MNAGCSIQENKTCIVCEFHTQESGWENTEEGVAEAGCPWVSV